MPWFYYSGNVAKPIPVKRGLTVSVAPHTRVEIFDTSLREVQVLRRKGELRPTGKPSGVKSLKQVAPDNSQSIAAVTKRSALAKSTAEKGTTTSPTMAPKPSRGRPQEMTEGEKGAASGKVVQASKPAVSAKTPSEEKKEEPAISMPEKLDSDLGDKSENKDAESVEVLSDVDGSPEDKSEGEKPKARKKKRRKK